MNWNHTFDWDGTSSDPSDEQFGHVVETADLEAVAEGDYDAVLVGEPTDEAVIGRKGAAEGPAALREQLAGTKTHHFDAGPVAGVADLGDVTVDELDSADADGVRGIQQRAREAAGAVHDADAFPVFLGGDNSLTFPNVAPLLDAGSVGVVNLDAHLDVREVREKRGGKRPTSGTPYRQLFEAGLDGYACVGARHFETSTAYADFVREQGGAVVTAEEVGDSEIDAADRAIDAMSEVDLIYVSLDLDVLDAASAPGVSAPTPGGISTRELFRLLRLLGAEDRLAGFEVVECAPRLDRDGLTAMAGARAIAHLLSTRSA